MTIYWSLIFSQNWNIYRKAQFYSGYIACKYSVSAEKEYTNFTIKQIRLLEYNR